MKAGFGNLYGYTSDKEDIRHSLLQEPAPSVDETDALFMLGACAAFVSYVINKSRLAGLLTSVRLSRAAFTPPWSVEERPGGDVIHYPRRQRTGTCLPLF